MDDVAKHVRQTAIAAAVTVCEPHVIETDEVQDRRVKIVDVNNFKTRPQFDFCSFQRS